MRVNSECLACGICIEECAFGAIRLVDGKAVINSDLCTNCGSCAKICPVNAIEEYDCNEYKPLNRQRSSMSGNPGQSTIGIGMSPGLVRRLGAGRGMGKGKGSGMGIGSIGRGQGTGGCGKGQGSGRRRGMGKGLW